VSAVKSRVYIESTIISYLTAVPSRDLVRAALQQLTRDWWATRGQYDLYISQFVIDEVSGGDPTTATERLAVLRDTALLATTANAALLARDLVRAGDLPPKAMVDAFHIAVAAVHGLDYLLTWNCRHIANVEMRGRIEGTCRSHGIEPPAICTPVECSKE